MSPDDSSAPGDCILVFTNFPSVEVARDIATKLVEQELAACVNILPAAESIYRWKGAMEHEAEVPALIKTTLGGFGELETALSELHPYETPEIIALPIIAGSQAYLDWVQESVRDGEPA